MTNPTDLLVLDQGTTSTRAIRFDAAFRPGAVHQLELPQSFPQPGWVEHDARLIWQHSLEALRRVSAGEADQISAVGITNQRETVVLWERASGEPLHPALVWQDRRTAERCRQLREEGLEEEIRTRTGLVLDPYFSATKLAWLLDQIPGARQRAARGELAAGTIDSFLLWHLTSGRVHATDATNASRTQLFHLAEQRWDEDLLHWFDVPVEVLPEVRDTAADFGATAAGLLDRSLPIHAMVGDQQAAAFGQGCWEPGVWKCTYGTGGFLLCPTGDAPVHSQQRLLGTVATRLGGHPRFALEGSIFHAGSIIQWLRDALGILTTAEESAELAAAARTDAEVDLVPAFTGLGAPWWSPHARGALFGLTRDCGRAELVRAGLEAVALQTADLVQAAASDLGQAPDSLRVDGGMAQNDWLMQEVANILDLRVERPEFTESTALGAAFLAGLGAGTVASIEDLAVHLSLEREFTAEMQPQERQARLKRWHRAVAKTLDV